jgi:hypothetical protein
LKVVTQYLPQDEAARDVYDDHWVIFVPNLLMADNELRLAKIPQACWRSEPFSTKSG